MFLAGPSAVVVKYCVSMFIYIANREKDKVGSHKASSLSSIMTAHSSYRTGHGRALMSTLITAKGTTRFLRPDQPDN